MSSLMEIVFQVPMELGTSTLISSMDGMKANFRRLWTTVLLLQNKTGTIPLVTALQAKKVHMMEASH
jgi:hypothetical protein